MWQGMALSQGGRGVLLAWVAPWPRPDVPAPAAELDADRRSFGPGGRRYGCYKGPSGTRKSRFVAARWPDAFWKAPESKWWDGYSGQETVVMTTSRTTRALVELQRLLDWYPLWVEVKGGSVPMMAKRYV